MSKRTSRTESVLNEAWIGDAVLTLHARLQVLREAGRIDAGRAAAMTSNQFLSALGEPAAVEAAIGRVYLAEGLEAAFAWVGQRLGPVLARQDENRARRAGTKRQKPA
jgi:dsRNA-specific ribonuclease